MPRERAAYMREYRAKKRAAPIVGSITPNDGDPIPFAGSATEVIAELSGRILALTDEVARLKRELAARPAPLRDDRPFAEFRPAPKPSRR